MGRPMISVVTPSYNQGKYLNDAIDSIKNQTYGAVEHIVIDGGSTDESRAVLADREKDLAYWVSEPDHGQAAAVNKGWAVAQGEILAFLNADDFYYPGAFQVVADVMSQYPDAGLVHGQGMWVDDRGVAVMPTSIKITSADFWRRLPGIPQPAAFIRREVVDAVGPLDCSFHFALDGEFFSRVAGRYPILSLDNVFAALRVHRAAKSTAEGFRFSAELVRLGAKIAANLDSYPNFTASPEEVMAAALRVSARFAYMNGHPLEGIRKLLASTALDPQALLPCTVPEVGRLLAFAALGRSRYRRAAAHARRARARL